MHTHTIHTAERHVESVAVKHFLKITGLNQTPQQWCGSRPVAVPGARFAQVQLSLEQLNWIELWEVHLVFVVILNHHWNEKCLLTPLWPSQRSHDGAPRYCHVATELPLVWLALATPGCGSILGFPWSKPSWSCIHCGQTGSASLCLSSLGLFTP